MAEGAVDNPYKKAPSSQSHGGGQGARVDPAIFSSKRLADEIHRDDLEMERDLTALAPFSGRSYRIDHRAAASKLSECPGGVSGGGTGTMARSNASSSPAAVFEVRDNVTIDKFIEKKREVGLVRMSLATKRAEIRKLEESVDRAEKKLHQQQDQLESTRDKFNNFLKHSNLEQDAAVRRADGETKAKEEKTVEIKKLSVLITRVELEIRKTEMQLANCRSYKKFLHDLSKQRWFYDVVMETRIADRTEALLLEVERAYELRSEAVRTAHAELLAARAAAEAKKSEGTGRLFMAPRRASVEEDEEEELVDVEVQLDQLHEEMERQVQCDVDEATEAICECVNAMTVEEAREELDRFDESRVPMYFEDVNQFLEVFVHVEEGNLFLIQNCQELEEELEGVAMDYMTERDDMRNMTQQRHTQMSALAEKIRFAQEKMQQLESRSAALDSTSVTSAAPASASAAVSSTEKGKAAAANAAADVPPEVFKTLVETKIFTIFRTLTAGDNAIKTAAASRQSRAAQLLAAEAGDGSAAEGGGADDGVSEGRRGTRPGTSATATGTGASVRGAGKSEKKRRGPAKPREGRSLSSVRGTQSKKGAAGAAAGMGQDASQNEAGANMGPVEMLTIIENKLEEYHRFITDPANDVEDALMQAVMKASDKERRRQARQVHVAAQAAEQEDRIRKALERSQAPVVRQTGKPVLRRSRIRVEETEKEKKVNVGASDSDGDGAEFFR